MHQYHIYKKKKVELVKVFTHEIRVCYTMGYKHIFILLTVNR